MSEGRVGRFMLSESDRKVLSELLKDTTPKGKATYWQVRNALERKAG